MDEQLSLLVLEEGKADIAPVGRKHMTKEILVMVVTICPYCDHTSSTTEFVKSWVIANRVKSGLWEKTGESEYAQHVPCDDENCPGRL